MCEVQCVVEQGLIDSEKVALISTWDGVTEEVTVSARSATTNTIRASVVGTENGRVLIELPRETSSGRWRIWVTADKIVSWQ